MPTHVFVRHTCGRCDDRVETRATDDDGRPVRSAPRGWSRGKHRGRAYQVCLDCLATGGMGAWLVNNAEREEIMGTTIHLRHECDKCHATTESAVGDEGPAPYTPPEWALFAVNGEPILYCPACVATLRAFGEANANAEQSP